MNTQSYYQYHVFICTNQRNDGRPCCEDQQASHLRDYMKKRVKDLVPKELANIRINNAGCLNRCSLGPVLVIYPQAVWYSYKNQADIDEIVETHLLQGKIVERLYIKD